MMKFLWGLLLLGSFEKYAYAQWPCPLPASTPAGIADSCFNMGATGLDSYGEIDAFAVQPDGKVIVAGDFTFYDGIPNIGSPIRINPDGSLDTTFHSPTRSDECYAVALQADGKILIGGTNSNTFLRLMPNGDPDTSFHWSYARLTSVRAIAVQPDGKIVIGGDIFEPANRTRSILRFLPSGMLDTTFHIGTGLERGTSETTVYCLSILPDGRILAGGNFQYCNGFPISGLVRLQPDGSRDASFHQTDNLVIHCLYRLPRGKLLIGGDFVVASPGSSAIIRLDSTGAVDPAFRSPFSHTITEAHIRSIAVQTDGRILLGGDQTYNDSSKFVVSRLLPNGARDVSFSGGRATANGGSGSTYAYAIALLPDGKLLVGGRFRTYAANGRHPQQLQSIARLFADAGVVSTMPSLKAKGIGAYPNPASTVVSLACADPIVGQVALYTPNGQLLYIEARVTPSGYELPIEGLAVGLYTLVAQTTTGMLRIHLEIAR